MANCKASGDNKMPADLFKKAPEAFRKRAWILINIILAAAPSTGKVRLRDRKTPQQNPNVWL